MTPAPQPLAYTPRRRALWSVLLVAIFGLQLGLIVRTHVQRDDQYGFAMFHETITYRLTYKWVLENGRKPRYKPEDGVLLSRGKKLEGSRTRTSVMGLGTVRMQTLDFMEWSWLNKRPDGAVGIEATFRYRVNGLPEWTTERLAWPPADEEAP